MEKVFCINCEYHRTLQLSFIEHHKCIRIKNVDTYDTPIEIEHHTNYFDLNIDNKKNGCKGYKEKEKNWVNKLWDLIMTRK